ncbi:imidazoleglycerol-phosphate dehydratase [Vulcanisaeta thermophila]|uniref:imidazoleglycerol-phosphate dehydratase n=1 Tax=Vulcanisaeta thermophila TaxID=867917 RepID=UPI000853330D|nr:imidazoleglycerol-phosphate dehydratase [Vulcanisaeta thermophila]
MTREAHFERSTRETRVKVRVSLTPGEVRVSTPVRFFNHMLETLIFYMGASGEVYAEDLRGFDDHHVIEDVAIALGTALDKALGDRIGIRRFGWSLVPMDDALALTAVDLGGRAYWVFRGSFTKGVIGDMTSSMIPHFIRTLATYLRATVHVEIKWGEDDHHIAEAVFKSLGLSLGMAMELINDRVMSTKGSL